MGLHDEAFATEYRDVKGGIGELPQACLAFSQEGEGSLPFGHVTDRNHARPVLAKVAEFRLKLCAETGAVFAYRGDDVGALVARYHMPRDHRQIRGCDA